MSELDNNLEKYRKFGNILRNELSAISEIKWITDENCSPHVLTFAFKTVRGEVMQHALEVQGVLVGTGSACSARRSHDRIPSALGLKEYSDGLLRVSFGRENTQDEVVVLAEKIKENYEILRKYIGR